MADYTDTWPPRARGALTKPSASARKALKKKHRRELQTAERDNKGEARKRDSYRCRFPSCGCKKLGLLLEVSHWRQHKGMGGDKLGTRSDVEDLITVCNHRHKDGRISIDKGTLQVRPLTKHGASGPIEWWMDATAYAGEAGPARWVKLAREERVAGPYVQVTLGQLEMLHGLGLMVA